MSRVVGVDVSNTNKDRSAAVVLKKINGKIKILGGFSSKNSKKVEEYVRRKINDK